MHVLDYQFSEYRIKVRPTMKKSVFIEMGCGLNS